MSANEAGEASNSKRQRVSRACDLCRRKKIKCDGLLPVCTNCQAFKLECSYNDTTKKRGPPKGYIEAIENRLHRLEQLLVDVAEDIEESRSRKLLAELHAPLETPYGESIKTRPIRRGRRAQKNRIFLWQQKDGSASSLSPSSPTPSSTQLLECPSELDEVEEQHPEIRGTNESSNDVNGQLSMDETGQVRYIGKSSGLYYIQNSRWYHDGAFHLAEWNRTKNNVAYQNKAHLDPFELPPKDLSYDLISIYFTHFYPVLPMFYKKRLALTYDPHSDAMSPLLLNAIYALSSRISPDIRVRSDPDAQDTAGEIFFERAKMLLDSYYDVPKIATVQALLLLAIHQHGAMKGARAWLYSGMAFRMAQDLGLHRNCDHWNIPLEERERRKRVFWCCFIMDRLLGATYGRASLFEERDCDVPFPTVDDDEGCSHGEGQNVRVLDAFVHQIKVCDILGHVLKSIYYAKGRHHAGTPHLDRVLAGLRKELDNWYNTIPPSLRLLTTPACHMLMPSQILSRPSKKTTISSLLLILSYIIPS
ncbi:fungal-specific transcription factor domain-containing protein [Dichotomocladium elegans]|nr:fungal-specific transcription factor domain-containing protein [Dichotomocladium elegans]